MTNRPLLSICIPTYNRARLIEGLIMSILRVEGSFEVVVEIDGSSDDTLERLNSISDRRLRVGYAANAGRASAMARAVEKSRGQFVMLFDDDDSLTPSGLALVLEDCAEAAEQCDPTIGFIYHLADDHGEQIGGDFPNLRSNFVKIRAEERVSGDKKEVVRGDLLRSAMTGVDGKYRRIPTSLFWARLALIGDVRCRNEVIGQKRYLANGMSDGIRALKRSSPVPMVWVHKARLANFSARRTKSVFYAARSLAALLFYTLLSAKRAITSWR